MVIYRKKPKEASYYSELIFFQMSNSKYQASQRYTQAAQQRISDSCVCSEWSAL